MMSLIDRILTRDLLPDPVIRFGIRRLLAQRLAEEYAGGFEALSERQARLVDELRQSPIAIHPDAANEQHYEIPSELFELVLGRRLKYSSGYWPDGVSSLDEAEEAMLELYPERAELEDGQRILELGCGWGSLTLFLAERFPKSTILAISNSASQQDFIREAARDRGLRNITLHRADINDFDPGQRFDRVVSVEMFEHLRNYDLLFKRIASWLEPEGKLFTHIFCHRHVAYPFEDKDGTDWMSRYFFTGGLMPSADLFREFEGPLRLEERWLLSGVHYQKTALAWLAAMDARREAIEPILARTYGRSEMRRWWVYWRVFFMSCAELFAYHGGDEWMVAHYRFTKA